MPAVPTTKVFPTFVTPACGPPVSIGISAPGRTVTVPAALLKPEEKAGSKAEVPVGPVQHGPVGPVVPVAPVGPVTPVAPVAPVAPVEPVAPVGPVQHGPVSPKPVAPVGPRMPVGPVGPRIPVKPVGPIGPIGPIGQIGFPGNGAIQCPHCTEWSNFCFCGDYISESIILK